MFYWEVERGCGWMCSFGMCVSSSDELGLGGRHVVSVTPTEAVVCRRQRGAWRAPLRAEARMARSESGARRPESEARRPWRG